MRLMPFISCIFLLTLIQPALADEPSETYQFIPVTEKISVPWHTHYLSTSPTPSNTLNAGADYLNRFVDAALNNRLEKTAAKTPWQQYSKFLNWASWAYLSPDSQFQGDERLVAMMQTWLDTFFVLVSTQPDDPKKAESWTANRIHDTWSFHDYSLPLLAIESNSQLQQKIGLYRIKRYRQILVDSIADMTTVSTFNSLIQRADNYVNMATHPMAVYIHGWLITGETKYLKMAQSIVAILHRDQMPNGMFPYRHKLHGPDHIEYETMYYRAIEMRALFIFWWATGSQMAFECLKRSTPWYPLNMEPPYHFNDGADIWWKDQWRTFWPMHIAMVGAAAKDGENATIALNMARDRKSFDRFDLVLGALAYQQMTDITLKPIRDQYIMADPDIRGLRLRHTPWSTTFTTGSFTYTRASAMRVTDDGKGFDALHMARPCVRVTPLTKRSRIDPDYTMLGAEGADRVWIIKDEFAVVGTTYLPSRTLKTWRPTIPTAPWQMTEIWMMSPQGMVGIIDSRATESQEIVELNHQYRFIADNNQCSPVDGQPDTWLAGKLTLTIIQTNFQHRVLERVRRFALNAKDRRDFQVSLTDVKRLPEQIAQDEKLSDEQKTLLPTEHTIEAGYHRYSLACIAPDDVDVNFAPKRLEHASLVGFSFVIQNKRYGVWFNPTTETVGIDRKQTDPTSMITSGKIKLVAMD